MCICTEIFATVHEETFGVVKEEFQYNDRKYEYLLSLKNKLKRSKSKQVHDKVKRFQQKQRI